jgi:integrase/recombinase XerD
MFRDTFAVEMLRAGVPIDQFLVLLGHKRVKITEKHCEPWVRARQGQLEQSVQAAWRRQGNGERKEASLRGLLLDEGTHRFD